jgi:hypothetical protein
MCSQIQFNLRVRVPQEQRDALLVGDEQIPKKKNSASLSRASRASTTQRPPVTEKRPIGEGTVIRLMGDKYAALEVPASVRFREVTTPNRIETRCIARSATPQAPSPN